MVGFLSRLRIQGLISLAVALGILSATSAQADIVIGQTTAITGDAAASVGEIQIGVNLYLDSVNAKGGVNGEKIKLITLDDQFVPTNAAANAQRLIEKENVVALFMSRGTAHTQAMLPWLAKHGVALIAPSTGAMIFHQPVNPLIFNVRSSYQAETEKAVEQLSMLGIKRIAMVHVDDTFGEDCLVGAMKGFQKVDIKPAIIIKADRTAPDFASIVQQLIKADTQAVVWVGSNVAVSDGVKALRKAGSTMQVITGSNNASAGFTQQLGDAVRGVMVTQVFPNERSLGYAINREATALAKAKAGVELSPSVMEGFASAKVLVEGLRRSGPRPTREKVVAAFSYLSHYDLGGLELGYGPGDRTGLSFVDVSIIDGNGQFRR